MFLMQNGLEELRFPGLTVEFLDQTTETAKFDLSLGVAEQGDILITGVEYSTELFEATTIRRLLQHYESLLQAIVALPGQSISELPLLAESERRQLLVEWSPPAKPTPRGTCVHQWFEVQAERTPAAIAVTCEGRNLTYQELNVRANQVAHRLQ